MSEWIIMGRQATFIYDKNILTRKVQVRIQWSVSTIYYKSYDIHLWVELATFPNENFYGDHNQTEFKIAHE